MEPLYQKVEIANDVSFFMKDTFSPLFHFHMAYELILFRRGTGNAIIGNKTTDYKESSLFMLGPNLPHCFTSFDNNENMAFVIQVKREILEGLTDLIPEIGSIILMLEKSKYGLKFNQSIGSNYHNRINRLYKLDGLDRLMDLISMLHDLSKIKQVELLTSPETNLNVNLKEYDRINSVYEFVFKNFQNPIPLDNISSLLNITNIAFCRYFKKITQKTFVTYLVVP